MLNNIKKQQGFTIVELLIVIVVIAILAAISIVAYNGIQNRGKASSAQSAAATIQKKAEAANAITSAYPSSTGSSAGGFGENQDSSLTGSGITLAAISAAPSNANTVEYMKCTAGATGARIAYWDYSANAKSSYINLGTTTGCTTWGSALTGGPF